MDLQFAFFFLQLSGFNFWPCTPTSKVHQVNVPPGSPPCCYCPLHLHELSESLLRAKPSAWETCTQGALLKLQRTQHTHHLPGRGFFFPAEHWDTVSSSVQAAARYVRLTTARTERGSTRYRVYRRYIKLISSATRCLSFATQAAAAASAARSGLPEGYTYRKPKQKSRFPGSTHAHAHGVSASVSQGREVKILLLGVCVSLRSGGFFFFSSSL